MKKLILLLFLICSATHANERKTDSEITEVTVYLQGARISREAVITLKSGINEVLLGGLSTLIDENSIQFKRTQHGLRTGN